MSQNLVGLSITHEGNIRMNPAKDFRTSIGIIGIFFTLTILLSLVTLEVDGQQSKSEMAGPQTKVLELRQYTIEQFMSTVRVGGSSFSSDEKSILFHSNKSGIFNVYSVPVAGGEPTQLTKSEKESTYAVSYFPADARILYTYDHGGNENSHLYVREADGTERDLTPGDKVKANFLGWSHDRKSFFLSTNERDPRFFDIFEMASTDFKPTLIYKDETGLAFGDISNDRNFVAFQKSGGSPADSDVYLYNVAAKELKNITTHSGDVTNSPQAFAVNSKYLYYLTDEGSEFQHLERFDLGSGKHELVEKAPWDISSTYFSHNGRYRVTAINEDGRTKIEIKDETTGKPVALPKLPNGDITGVNISPSEKLMVFYVNGDRSPSNLYVYNFSTQKVTKLTESLNPEINPSDLVDSQVIRYKSFDGVEIPSILYKPKNASSQLKTPALLLIHGGPGGQTRVGYSALTQYLVNHGYVVLGVNNRGSSGYGKTFFSSDDGKHGREPLWDCVEAKKYLSSLGYVDEKKIGIMGGSYGGYMVLAALAFKPDEFAEIVKPLIVLQGVNDPRVIKPESDEIVDNIKKRNGVVEYVVFENEGHGFTKKANEIRAYKAILNFLDHYLKGTTTAGNTTPSDRQLQNRER